MNHKFWFLTMLLLAIVSGALGLLADDKLLMFYSGVGVCAAYTEFLELI